MKKRFGADDPNKTHVSVIAWIFGDRAGVVAVFLRFLA